MFVFVETFMPDRFEPCNNKNTKTLKKIHGRRCAAAHPKTDEERARAAIDSQTIRQAKQTI